MGLRDPLACLRICARLLGPLLALRCGGTLDAGQDVPHGQLPVDERSPVILNNDGPQDNWQGEYALLLANAGRLQLAGIVINDSGAWPDLDANMTGWNELVAAARASGMRNAPDPLASAAPRLTRPDNGDIDATIPNGSTGAHFIVDQSLRLARSYRPLVVATGGRLTEVADAYLVDHTLPDRVVVVSSLGTISGSGARMGEPNGEMDPWADTIVVNRFRYVQVSAYYDQTADVPPSQVASLPANPFGAWMANKNGNIFNIVVASDQVSIAALAMGGFVREVERMAQNGTESTSAGSRPTLGSAPAGSIWVVTQSDGSVPAATLWQLLRDPSVFAQ
jgi:hypothetical protein